MRKNMISIAEIVKKYGIPFSTINHYTNVGLLNIVGRNKNIRLYDEIKVRDALRRIAELRGKGYPLHLIQTELNTT